MSETEQTLWGIHAGRRGDADSLFLQKNVVAVGWQELGDITAIGADRIWGRPLFSNCRYLMEGRSRLRWVVTRARPAIQY